MVERKLNVLQIITGLRPGGAERLLLEICKTLKNSEITNIIVASIAPDNGLYEDFREAEIEIYQLSTKKSIYESFNVARRLLVLVKKFKIEVIHAHMYHSLLMACVLKIFNPSLKIVFTPHNISFASIDQDSVSSFKARIRHKIIQCTKVLRSIDIIFAYSMKNNAISDNYSVIPNGIDTSKFNKVATKYEKFSFLSVGRLDYVKNQTLLIDIFDLYKCDLHDAQLLLVGTGVSENELKDKVNKLGLQDSVVFLGFQSDTSIYYRRSHVFLMPSLWEGMPLSLLEAGAANIPIITTSVGAIADIAAESNVYFSSLEDFCRKMVFVKQHYDEALKKALLFRNEVMDKYDIDVTAQKHESLYHSI
jgi:glycosyltransferase involved in cell wall biosynthesis